MTTQNNTKMGSMKVVKNVLVTAVYEEKPEQGNCISPNVHKSFNESGGFDSILQQITKEQA